MKLRQLQCLRAVVEAGFNISRAAVLLHATQPAISKQLRQFEEEIGMDLLLRQGGRPVALTDAGERTLVWVRRALQCAENIRVVAREENGAGNLTLATSHTHAHYVLLPTVLGFAKQFPRVRVQVLQGTPDLVAELVREGQAHVGVTLLPSVLPKEVVAAPFLSSSRLLIAPAGHPLLDEKDLTLESIAAYPILIPHSSRPNGARIVGRFRDAGLEVTVAVQALDTDVIKTYAEAGLGVGIIPAFCYSPLTDSGLAARDVGHLFDSAVSAVLLRRHSHLPQYVYEFIAALDPVLRREALEALVFDEPELLPGRRAIKGVRLHGRHAPCGEAPGPLVNQPPGSSFTETKNGNKQ